MDMYDEDLLRRHLLGELSAEAMEGVERRLLQEDDFFELAEAIEGELLADYARGELAPEERESIRRRLASSRSGRARLDLAQGLARIADEGAMPPIPIRPSLLEFRRWTPSVRRTAFSAAALAASLLVAVGLYTVHRHQQQNPVVIGDNGRAQIGGNVPTLPSPTVEATPPPVEPAPPPAPTPVAPEPEAPADPEPQPSAQPVLEPAVIELAIATLRGGGNLPTFEIVQDSREVEFQIDLEGEDFVSYDVVLRDSVHRELWKGTRKPQQKDWGPVLVFGPVADLPSGKYRLEVSGVTADGTREPLGPLSFVIQRR
jgi:hypothetical protein